MKKIKVFFKFLWLVLRLIRNPNDVSPIFKTSEFRNHKSFRYCLAKAQEDVATAHLMRTKYLADKPYNLDELAQLPEGTLGNLFAKHMRHFKLNVVFYPNDDIKNADTDDINWFRKRARETHDIFHAILGYPPDHLGEMKVSAFYLAQINSPLSAILIGVGFFIATLKKPHIIPQLVESVIEGWLAGQKATKLMGLKWENLWDVPVYQLRQEFNIIVTQEAFERTPQAAIEKIEKKYFENLSLQPIKFSNQSQIEVEHALM